MSSSNKVTILQSKCDPSMADDKSLPYTAYLVEYVDNGITYYDITTGSKQVDIFDYYYDTYREGFRNMTQTHGRVNPKLYGYGKAKKK